MSGIAKQTIRAIPHLGLHAMMLDCMRRFIELGQENCSRVEIPYDGSSFPGLLVRAEASRPAPCMVFVNGLDSVKEIVYRCGIAQALSKRGVSTLIVDQPGTGEALRLRGLTAIPNAEKWASPVLDVLAARDDVDREKIGIMGWSLGGYFAPRAAAFEPRFGLCVAWGASYDWGEVQRQRPAREGDRPVPHYWEHVQYGCGWGQSDLDEFIRFVSRVTLAGMLG
jgi:pimeloyl-ACP methyl ester carboxylesterase